jgi:hypothetical protein
VVGIRSSGEWRGGSSSSGWSAVRASGGKVRPLLAGAQLGQVAGRFAPGLVFASAQGCLDACLWQEGAAGSFIRSVRWWRAGGEGWRLRGEAELSVSGTAAAARRAPV